MSNGHQSFSIETYARRSANYLNRMVDSDGLPYFNVFSTNPAEAAHDRPDFGDVMSRQLQAAVMYRHMTGDRLPIEDVWYRKSLSMIDPEIGLLRRPKTDFSEPTANLGDACLTLYAYVTAWLDNRDENLRQVILRMVDAAFVMGRGTGGTDCPWHGFIIKSLMVCARFMDYQPALELAGKISSADLANEKHFTSDNMFGHRGHMHALLRTLVGIADYAVYTGDSEKLERVDALYRFVRSIATRFGFLPELLWRDADIIGCETCSIMDYLGLAATLANHGHPEYWGDVERTARNHLVESQSIDSSWLISDPSRPDTDQFSWREIGERSIGAWAGWSAPNHILAYHESVPWGGPALQNKPRAFQNCCGGSGVHALFIVWKNASRFTDGCLQVNLHIDKLLPQAEIRGYQPWKGLLTIKLNESCRVRVRIPEFITAQEVKVISNGRKIEALADSAYLDIGERPSGDMLEITYPLPVFVEEITVGNPGYRRYRYRVKWKGDTVVKMMPVGNDDPTGYSDLENREIPVFYGEQGPGPLYERGWMLADTLPSPSELRIDNGTLDFWDIA